MKVKGQIKVFPVEADMRDFNLDGKVLDNADKNILNEWCFGTKNKGLHNSERRIAITNKNRLSSKLTWKIMKRYVANYKKLKNVTSCSYKDLYNYYEELMKNNKK